LSGGAFDNPPEYNFAVGGSTTVNVVSTQLSPLIAAIAANGIRFVCISIGTNDANSGATIANIETRLLDIANQIVNAGATPIFLSPPPRVIASGAVANFDKRLGWVSSYITNRLPLAVPGVVTIGGWQGTFDPATNQPYGGVTPTANDHFVDGTHLSARGAHHAGKQLAAYMQTRNVGRPSTTMTGRSVYDATENPIGPIIAPVFNATAAYSGGDANITGVVPTGWTVERSSGTGTMVCSIGTPTVDGLAVNSFRMVATGAGGVVGTMIAYAQLAPPAGLENKALKCRMRVRITGASNLRFVELRNRVDNSVGPTSTSTFDMYRVIDGSTTFNWPDGTYDMTLDATAVTLPASLATVTIRAQLSTSVAVGGSATVDILSIEWVPA
jgi:lysophospholipase L1-like esterase